MAADREEVAVAMQGVVKEGDLAAAVVSEAASTGVHGACICGEAVAMATLVAGAASSPAVAKQ